MEVGQEDMRGDNMEIKANIPCLYFVSDGQGNCKIGVASDIKGRMNNLQVGSAFELRIKNIIYFGTIDEAYEMERQYHADLAPKNVRGEWFEEKAVEDYMNGKMPDDNRVYMSDICPEFNIFDALKLFDISMSSKTINEAADRYNNEMPEYWKEYDKQNQVQHIHPLSVSTEQKRKAKSYDEP